MRLCQELQLEEGDKAVVRMDKKTFLVGCRNLDRCLVRKVIRVKIVNCEAFRRVMPTSWRLLGGVEIEIMGNDNIFIAQFKNVQDMLGVYTGGLWNFDR